MANRAGKLTPQQKQLCEFYLIYMNIGKAAIKAGYTERSARQSGFAALNRPHVAAYLEKITAARNKRLNMEVNADYVMARLHAIESFDITDLFDATGALLPVSEWPEGAGMVVAGLTLDERKIPTGDGDYEDRITKALKMESRLTALNTLGKMKSIGAFDTTLNLENLEGVTFNITMKEG